MEGVEVPLQIEVGVVGIPHPEKVKAVRTSTDVQNKSVFLGTSGADSG